MPCSRGIPTPVLEALRRIEPGAEFVQTGHHVQSTASNRSYFAKFGTIHDVEHYMGEAESLRAMYAACPGICPRVFECSVDPTSQKPLFISEYKKIGSLNKNAAAVLGGMLADMHMKGQSSNGKFGFEVPTYCGATKMRNGWHSSWGETYDRKIADLLETLEKRGGYEDLCDLGKQVREKAIPRLLGSLTIKPAILHGDLWSGNAGTDTDTGDPVTFDPSSYYGHNEADLSIARIFGGFPPAFFAAYHEKIPPSEPAEEYDTRGALYEVFHYLNHTVLFGGSYASMAKQKMGIVMRYVLENKKVSPL